MGQLQSCSCENSQLIQESIDTLTLQAPTNKPINSNINGPLGFCQVLQKSKDYTPQYDKVINSQIQKSQILSTDLLNSQRNGTLTSVDFVIPPHVTKALINLGEYIVDSKLVEMFKDCPQIMFTDLDENGEFYLGQKSHGIRTGFGKVLYFDQSYYEGFWFNNERNFNGRFVDKDGDAYVGEWFANQMNGIGKFFHHNGTIFDTTQGMNEKQRNEMITKSPAQSYPDGKLYYGQLTDGKKNGLGLLIWSDKSEYFGHYSDGKQQGYGIMQFQDGRKYEGMWNNGTMHGFGKFTWPNSQLFIGIYNNDVKENYGMFIWPDGCKYRGMFKNGLMNGIGRVVDTEGRILEGEWINGKRVQSPSMNIFSDKSNTSRVLDQDNKECMFDDQDLNINQVPNRENQQFNNNKKLKSIICLEVVKKLVTTQNLSMSRNVDDQNSPDDKNAPDERLLFLQ